MGGRPFRFMVRVKPSARKEAVGGRWEAASGPALMVAVAAPAVDGRANDAVRRALAMQFGIRPRDVRVVAGLRSRDKLIELDPAPLDARARLDLLLAQ